MPPTPRKAVGRRDPSLLQGPETGDPLVQHELGPDEAEQSHSDVSTDLDTPEDALLFLGDIVTCNVTLAVDVTGNGKTDFVGYRATTRLQPGEDHGEAFSRVVSVVSDGVISAADDVAGRWEVYEQAIQAQRETALRITGGPRQ